MQQSNCLLKGAVVLAAAITLSACGGSSSSSSADSPSDGVRPPTDEQIPPPSATEPDQDQDDDQSNDEPELPPQDDEGGEQDGADTDQPDPLTFCEDPEALFALDVDTVRPADGDTDVSLTAGVSFSLSHPPLSESITPNQVSLVNVADNSGVDLTVSVSGESVTLLPSDPLLPFTDYAFTLNASGMNGIEALECAQPGLDPKFLRIPVLENGEVEFEDQFIAAFTTGGESRLAVTRVVPAEEDGLVPITSDVRLTFNQPIDPSTLLCSGPQANVLVERIAGSDRFKVDSTCDVNGAEVVLTPESPFALQAEYRVTARLNGVAALSETADGAQLTANFQSTFNTGGVFALLDGEGVSRLSDIPGLGDVVALLLGTEQGSEGGDFSFDFPFDVPDDFDFFGDLDFPSSGLLPFALAEIGLLCESGNSVACLDEAVIITFPLPSEKGFENLLIAACDARTPQENCALGVALGFDVPSFDDFASSFEDFDFTNPFDAFLGVLIGEQGFVNLNAELLSNNGFGVLPNVIADGLASAFAFPANFDPESLDFFDDVPDFFSEPFVEFLNVFITVFQALAEDGDVLGLEVGNGQLLDVILLNGEQSPLVNVGALVLGDEFVPLSLDGQLLQLLDAVTPGVLFQGLNVVFCDAFGFGGFSLLCVNRN